MGNMSNPSINRWGLNLFWYRFWFVDKNLSKNLHSDAFIDELVYLFLNYGILFYKNIFFNKYWFFNKIKFKNFFNEHSSKYYRVVNFKNTILNINSIYYSRIKLKNIYFSKIWILKYQNWIIILFYAFKPYQKTSKKKNKKINKELDIFLDKTNSNVKFLKRIKSIYFYLFQFNYNKKNYYNF